MRTPDSWGGCCWISFLHSADRFCCWRLTGGSCGCGKPCVVWGSCLGSFLTITSMLSKPSTPAAERINKEYRPTLFIGPRHEGAVGKVVMRSGLEWTPRWGDRWDKNIISANPSGLLAVLLTVRYYLNSSLISYQNDPRNRDLTHQCQRPLAEKTEGLASAFKQIWSLVATLHPSPQPTGAAEATFLYARGHSGSGGHGLWDKKIVPEFAGSLKCLNHSYCLSQEPKLYLPPTQLPATG